MHACKTARVPQRNSCRRSATDTHIEVQNSKRAYIAARKAEELRAERAGLSAWQSGLAAGCAPPQAPAAGAAAPGSTDSENGGPAGAGALDEAGTCKGGDHPAYYGRGTWAHRAAPPAGGPRAVMALNDAGDVYGAAAGLQAADDGGGEPHCSSGAAARHAQRAVVRLRHRQCQESNVSLTALGGYRLRVRWQQDRCARHGPHALQRS